MPYLQAATNNIFGFQPGNGPQGRTNLYAVSSSDAVAILPGDAIVWTSSGTARAAATGDTPAAYPLIGVAAAPLTTDQYAATALNLLVYDDPQQVYAVAITTSAGMSMNQYGGAFLVIATATGTGIPSTLVGRSKMALGVAASSQQYFKMIGLHPVEALASGGYVITTSAGKPQKYLVMPSVASNQTPLTT